MPALQIRELPDSIHKLLVERARLERRTIAQEATVLLERALRIQPPSNQERRRLLLEDIRRNSPKLDFTKVPAPEDIIREERELR